MIKSFSNKGLAELWSKGTSSKINARMHTRVFERLDALDGASSTGDLNLPGFDFHPLKGFKPVRYTVHINGPWCITFEFHDGDAYKVDFEQYH
jgi:toxin HigB-1